MTKNRWFINSAKALRRFILLMLVLSGAAVLKPANSQVSVNVNIGAQPLWGPVGYDYVEYYYLPAYDVYYYVPRHQFVYLDGPKWRFASALPPRFGAIDLYSAPKVVINEPRAYLHYQTHKVKYAGGGPKTMVIRDSREPKYYVVKGHPNYGGGKKSAAPARSGNSSVKMKSSSSEHSQSPMKSSGGEKHGGGNSGGGKSSGGGKGHSGGKH